MGSGVSTKSIVKNNLSLNYHLKVGGLKAFGWKKGKQWTEEGEYEEKIDHDDVSYSTHDVTEGRYGPKVGEVTIEHHNKWTETKKHKTYTTYQNFVRANPYTNNTAVLVLEKFYNFFGKLRDIIWVLVTIALSLTAILFIGPFFIGMGEEFLSNPESIHILVLDALKIVAIIYGILVFITTVIAKVAKHLLKKSRGR